MKFKWRPFLLILIAGGLITACNQSPADREAQDRQKEVSEEQSASQKDSSGPEKRMPIETEEALVKEDSENTEDYIALVNGEGIPREEFERLYSVIEKEQKNLTPTKRYQLRVRTLNNLIMAAILKQKALEADLPVEATLVNQAMDQVLQNFHNNEREFLAALEAQDSTVEEFRQTIVNELKVARFQDMIMDRFDVNFTEGDLKDWYEEHKDSYVYPEVVKVSHILRELPEDATEEEIEKKKLEVLKIRQMIVRDGADFEEMVKRYSEDEESKDQGGVIGEIAPGMMVPTFDEVVFNLNVGQLSPPFRTYKGWHIAKVLDRKPPQQMSFEEAKKRGLLAVDYIENRKAQYFNDWLAAQREHSQFRMLDPEFVRVE